MDFIIGKEFPEKVIPLIEGAKQSIKIVVFDWRWYPQDPANPVQLFNQSLVRAVRRGVSVKVIANNDEIIKTLNEVGATAKKFSLKQIMHCKLMIIDDSIVIIGSHNYTQSAFQMNLELSVIINLDENNKNVLMFFDNLWQL